jgi:hypothetical protein
MFVPHSCRSILSGRKCSEPFEKLSGTVLLSESKKFALLDPRR